jgi:hypothetical protein
MLEQLRAELRAIQVWDRKDFAVTTFTELAAVPIRAARKAELVRKIAEIAARN